MSSEPDVSDGSLPDAKPFAADDWSADLGLTGSPDMPRSLMAACLCGERPGRGQCTGCPRIVPGETFPFSGPESNALRIWIDR